MSTSPRSLHQDKRHTHRSNHTVDHHTLDGRQSDPKCGYAYLAAPDPGGIIVLSCTRGFDAVTSRDPVAPAHDGATQEIAAQEIIAAVASLGGEAGVKDLAADLVGALSAMIKQQAAMQGRSAIEVLDELFLD
jgi:hypothetical protein